MYILCCSHLGSTSIGMSDSLSVTPDLCSSQSILSLYMIYIYNHILYIHIYTQYKYLILCALLQLTHKHTMYVETISQMVFSTIAQLVVSRCYLFSHGNWSYVRVLSFFFSHIHLYIHELYRLHTFTSRISFITI